MLHGTTLNIHVGRHVIHALGVDTAVGYEATHESSEGVELMPSPPKPPNFTA